MKDARAQRAEEFSREKQRRSADRRFDAYADFLTKARSFRNAIRQDGERRDPVFTTEAIDAIARSAHASSSLVFLVVESTATYDACRALVRVMRSVESLLHSSGPDARDDQWLELGHEMAHLLRVFQAGAREELEIGGLDRSQLLGHGS
jgi:hypothetical protein